MTSPALRPYLRKDAPALAALVEASIEELAAEDYSADQRAAWASFVEDEDAFAKRLGGMLTLVVASEDDILGFGALKDKTHIEFLFVHPDHARRGVATLICEALEKLAGARGTTSITVEASDTALPLFEGRGYVARQRNTKMIRGEWLASTTMAKKIAGATGGAA